MRLCQRFSTSLVAIDSKDFIRKGYRTKDKKFSQFRGVYGVAVKFEDKDEFEVKYDTILKKICDKYGLRRKHDVLKSYEILSALGYPQGPFFLEEFFNEIRSSLTNLEIYYTTIPSTKVPKIKKYGADKTGVELIDPISFLKELSPTYPHCCAWAYINEHPEDAMTPIHIDYFEGEITDAWKQIRSLPNIKVYVAGDECNCYISAADMIAKIIDLRLFSKRYTLYKTCIKECFPEATILFIDQLKSIVPVSKEKIDVGSKLAHPIVFLLKEGMHEEVVGSARESHVIGSSPIMDRILKLAHDAGGCYKFFDINIDQKLIQEGDYFVYFGAKGLETANYLRSIGYKIKPLSSSAL